MFKSGAVTQEVLEFELVIPLVVLCLNWRWRDVIVLHVVGSRHLMALVAVVIFSNLLYEVNMNFNHKAVTFLNCQFYPCNFFFL